MIHELPWYMDSSNLFLIISFFYISGFMLSSLFFHSAMLKKKSEDKLDRKFNSKESFIWFLFSIFWFLFSFVAFYYLIRTLFTEKGK